MPLQLVPLESLLGLDALNTVAPNGAGQGGGHPMQLSLDLIDEDPGQPRSDFDAEALQQLADTIAQRGVRQPVSVRRHPQQPSRWLLNFGARRLRASKLAGKTVIPAFVDSMADSYDQVIENEQREALKPLELALFVQRRLALGETQTEIARQLGKSRPYVSHAAALIDAPDWLMAAYRDGRCMGRSDLYDLRRLHDAHPDHVEAWASEGGAMTRDRIRAFGAELGQGQRSSEINEALAIPAVATNLATRAGHEQQVRRDTAVDTNPELRQDRTKLPTALVLRARLDDSVVSVVVDRSPDEPGKIFVRGTEKDSMLTVDASDLTLLGFVTG